MKSQLKWVGLVKMFVQKARNKKVFESAMKVKTFAAVAVAAWFQQLLACCHAEQH